MFRQDGKWLGFRPFGAPREEHQPSQAPSQRGRRSQGTELHHVGAHRVAKFCVTYHPSDWSTFLQHTHTPGCGGVSRHSQHEPPLPDPRYPRYLAAGVGRAMRLIRSLQPQRTDLNVSFVHQTIQQAVAWRVETRHVNYHQQFDLQTSKRFSM